jgi:hypothetical protein
MPDLLYKLDEQTARDYFGKYFATNYMTGALRANIGYPVFCWGDNHANLQKGICPVVVSNLYGFFSKYQEPAAMNTILSQKPVLHDHIFYMLNFLVDMANSDCLDNPYKINLQQSLLSILDKSHLASQANANIDKTKHPYVNSIKTQFLMTCFTFAKRTGTMTDFAPHVGSDGMRKTLLDTYGILIIDNSGFDDRQLGAIKTYVTAIPQAIRIPVAITCFDFLIDSERNKRITVHSFRCNGAFNVFGSKTGSWSENQFPQDYKKVECDGFTIVLAHEYNHNVDSIYVASSKELVAFRDRLLKMAGGDHVNYLRSMIENGYFEKNPQEFIASLANQYFCNSKEMLQLALQKARHGNYNQINQFILMSSIYSDADKTYFYETDKGGRVSSSAYPARKQDGLVMSISMGPSKYQFKYAEGVINAVSGP